MPQSTRTLLILITALGTASIGPRAKAQQRPPAPVVVAAVQEKSVAAEQTFVGTVNPTHFATIGSAVEGRVVKRLFEEGDRVEKDRELVHLLTDTIALELAGAEAELRLRKDQLAELENGTRPEEIAQAKARLEASVAREKFLTDRQKRVKNLYNTRNAVTEDQFDEATAAAVEAQQQHIEAQAAYDLAVAGPREELIAQARAQVAIQKAMVDRLRDDKAKHTIYSSFAGYVVRQHTEVGQWVKQGDPIADVVALDEVDIVLQVVEKSVPYISVGGKVKVEVPAIVGSNTFLGTVMATVPQADVRARTFPVKVRVKNTLRPDGPLLKAGMYARATLPAGDGRSALLVPKDAIVLGGPKPQVVIVQGAQKAGDVGTAKPLPVELGVAQGGLIQIIGDLKPGQLVVIQGNERLQPDQSVVLSHIDATSSE